MYYILSLLSGILIAVMIVFNGGLSQSYGINTAAVIIHLVGFFLISGYLILKKQHPFRRVQPWYLYLGGFIGVAVTLCNNLAYGKISVSAILAIGLLGQSITSLIIDETGLMKMPVRKFKKEKFFGLFLVFIGIACMINDFSPLPIAVSFFSGILLVFSRITNADLAENTSLEISTFFNYLFGLLTSVAVLLAFGKKEPGFLHFLPSQSPTVYLGGALGVCVILLSNYTVKKISALYLTLFLFIGQVFSGILLDIVLTQQFSLPNFLGGIFAALGLSINLFLDRRASS